LLVLAECVPPANNKENPMSLLTTCQICREDFRPGEVTIDFGEWKNDHDPGVKHYGHADCVLAKSSAELNRKRPAKKS
jgi:hypothetical protein